MVPRKIAIIGSPGSGKSTLARQLAAITDLPLYHLDQLYWLPGWQHKYKKAAWLERINEIVRQGAWIIDGNYYGTMDARIRAADLVVYLQISPLKAMWRICKRRLQYPHGARPDMAEGCKERLHIMTFRSIWRHPFVDKKDIENRIKEGAKHIRVIKNTRELRAFLQEMTGV